MTERDSYNPEARLASIYQELQQVFHADINLDDEMLQTFQTLGEQVANILGLNSYEGAFFGPPFANAALKTIRVNRLIEEDLDYLESQKVFANKLLQINNSYDYTTDVIHDERENQFANLVVVRGRLIDYFNEDFPEYEDWRSRAEKAGIDVAELLLVEDEQPTLEELQSRVQPIFDKRRELKPYMFERAAELAPHVRVQLPVKK